MLAHANLSEVVVESLAPINIERLARCNKACAQTVFPRFRMRKQCIAAAIRELEERNAALKAIRPPRPVKSAVAWFKREFIPLFARNNPYLEVEEVQRLLVEAYERLDAVGKQPYVDKAADDADRFAQEAAQHATAIARRDEAQRVLDTLRPIREDSDSEDEDEESDSEDEEESDSEEDSDLAD